MTGPAYSFVAGEPIGTISLSGYSTFGAAANNPRWGGPNIYTLNDDLYYTKGKHALRFGVAVNRYNIGATQLKVRSGSSDLYESRKFPHKG